MVSGGGLRSVCIRASCSALRTNSATTTYATAVKCRRLVVTAPFTRPPSSLFGGRGASTYRHRGYATSAAAAAETKSDEREEHTESPTSGGAETAEKVVSSAGSAGKPNPLPTADGTERTFSDRVNRLVEEIANLPLLEVADLNAALKKRLNLPDVAAMPVGMAMMPAAGAAGAQEDASVEDATPKKTTFAVKLTKFDEGKKIALIKEIKAIVPGLNLVQAKKFVESLPKVVKDDMGKDEAAKLKLALEACGGGCEIE